METFAAGARCRGESGGKKRIEATELSRHQPNADVGWKYFSLYSSVRLSCTCPFRLYFYIVVICVYEGGLSGHVCA